jgi:type IV pilus assembly protein PilE
MRQTKEYGFSLIEIMIVVAIVGILSAIAIPAYGSYVRKSRRSEAITTLLTTQRAYEAYFLQNSTYVGVNNTVTLPTTTNYVIENAATPTDTSYEIKATANTNSSQANVLQCNKLWVDHLGNKNPPDCWNT